MRPVLVGLFLFGCTEPSGPSVVEPLVVPEGFPEPVVPADNPITAEKVELGRHLFYETRLSGNETQSCGSCHFQEHGFAQPEVVSEGSTGELHARNVNSLVNVAYNSSITWANPVLTDVETHMLLPLFGDDPVEMDAPDEATLIARLAEDPLYVGLFEQAYPEGDRGWDPTIDAIGAFMRTLISGDSPFDRFTFQGEADALSDSQLRGMELFYSEELECHHCHGGFNFSEASTHADSVFDARLFQNTGLYNIDGQGAYPANNTGIFAITGEPEDMGRFRAPSLRNVAVTAPYLHDGSVETLEEVVRIYEAGGQLLEDGPYAGDGRISPLKSGLVAGFTLTDQERADLVAFLESLTDETFLTDPRFADPFAP